MSLGDHFNDELGTTAASAPGSGSWTPASARGSPCSSATASARCHPHAVWNYYTDQSGRLIAKKLHTGYTFFFNDGGYTELSVNPIDDEITTPLALSSHAPAVPVGHYGWTDTSYGTTPTRAACSRPPSPASRAASGAAPSAR